MDLLFDTSDFRDTARNIRRLPVEIREKAFRRALRHTSGKALTQVSRKVAAYTGLPYRKVREKARLGMPHADGIDIILRSGWIPLIEMKPKRLKRGGIGVDGRGSYRMAWIAMMRRGQGVFVREGKARGPVDELFGPNPAHAMGEDRHGEFERLAQEIVSRDLMDRVLHEIDYALSKA